MAINTVWSANPDKLTQLTGANGTLALPGPISPTFAATVAIQSILQYSTYVRILGVNATSATCTISTTFVAPAGAVLDVACVSTAAGTVTYTFGTGFKVSGTAAATTLTSMTVNFRSNGTNWEEVGRSLAIAY